MLTSGKLTEDSEDLNPESSDVVLRVEISGQECWEGWATEDQALGTGSKYFKAFLKSHLDCHCWPAPRYYNTDRKLR